MEEDTALAAATAAQLQLQPPSSPDTAGESFADAAAPRFGADGSDAPPQSEPPVAALAIAAFAAVAGLDEDMADAASARNLKASAPAAVDDPCSAVRSSAPSTELRSEASATDALSAVWRSQPCEEQSAAVGVEAVAGEGEHEEDEVDVTGEGEHEEDEVDDGGEDAEDDGNPLEPPLSSPLERMSSTGFAQAVPAEGQLVQSVGVEGGGGATPSVATAAGGMDAPIDAVSADALAAPAASATDVLPSPAAAAASPSAAERPTSPLSTYLLDYATNACDPALQSLVLPGVILHIVRLPDAGGGGAVSIPKGAPPARYTLVTAEPRAFADILITRYSFADHERCDALAFIKAAGPLPPPSLGSAVEGGAGRLAERLGGESTATWGTGPNSGCQPPGTGSESTTPGTSARGSAANSPRE